MITALFILVYLVLWILTGVIVMGIEDEIYTALFVGMFWPITLIAMGVSWAIETIAKKVF